MHRYSICVHHNMISYVVASDIPTKFMEATALLFLIPAVLLFIALVLSYLATCWSV